MLRTSRDDSFDPTPLRTYVAVFARRKWLFLLVVLAVPVAAVLVSLQRESLYEAKAQVLLSEQDLAGALSGAQGPLALDPDRVVSTQARIARTPDLARLVLRSAGVGSKTADELLETSDVSPVGSTNVLEFRVVDPLPVAAERLATAYAQQFVLYTRAIETAAIERARKGVVAEMSRLERQGASDSALYARLAEEAQTLRTMAALQTSRAQLLRRAEQAEKVEPRPARAAAYGFFVAVLLGIGFVVLLEALDTRVRSESDVADALGIPLLGRLSEPPKRLRGNVELAVIEEPDGADAESFRILRTNIEYANSKLGAELIMLTSAVRGEGKSTTAANIAASFARLGRRVVLVDLDLRRPSVHRRFGLSGTLGVSDVVLGRVALDQVLVRVPIASRRGKSPKRPFGRWATNSVADGGTLSKAATTTAMLEVLPAGATPTDVGEFVGARGVADLLLALRERADIVFVDAPPVLEVSDPMTLMTHMDALVAIARLGVVRHPMLRELRRLLDASSISALGVVITGADTTDGYGPYHHYGAHDAEDEELASRSALHLVRERLQQRPTTS
ncbi:MAG: P-loop NTPase [Actinobacteria bacterium]|nr:P-loop NTPase [Actinomycetota bacterium]